MELSIISLSYKKKELTVKCIASIYDLYKTEFENNSIEFLVIDNNSDDGSAEYIKKVISERKYKNVTLKENKENLGFSKGCNLGASLAKGEFLLFLNNDTMVKTKGFLEMVNFMKKNNIAVMGAKMQNIDGGPQLSFGKFYTLFNALIMLLGFERFELMKKNPEKITKVDWVSGGCMMVNRKIFISLNGFDTHFFMYMEDMEFCYRLKKSGNSVYYYPQASISHIGQGSSNRAFAILNIYKGLLYFYKKHEPSWQYAIIKIILFIKAKILLFFGKVTHNSYLINTYEQALTIF